MRRGPRWMLAGALGGLAAFAAIVVDQVLDGPLQLMDIAVNERVSQAQAAGFPAHALGGWLSLIGEAYTEAVAVVAAAGWMLWRKQRALAAWTLGVGLAAGLVVWGLKNVFDRERPPLGILHSYSFPSGHTFGAACVLGVVIVLGTETLIRAHHERPSRTGHYWVVALPLWALLALLTATGRVLRQAHWVTDTLGSMALGLALVSGILYTLSRKSRGGDPGPTAPPKPGKDTAPDPSAKAGRS